MAKSKPKTRKQLLAEIAELKTTAAATTADLQAKIETLRACQGELVRKRDHALLAEEKTRQQFDDLKTRLAFAEGEVQRMGGYIARVQEDDVVREELITVGDPDGQQQKVPKRKPTHFADLRYVERGVKQYLEGAGCATAGPSHRAGDREPPKHWVTY